MILLTASNVLVQYGDRLLLDHVDLVVKKRERVGLVGRNGAGKSTLLKVLSRDISPLEGQVTMPTDGTLAFLHQDITIDQKVTVLGEVLKAYSQLRKLEDDLAEINNEITHRTDYESEEYMTLLEKFSELTERHALLGGQSMEADAVKVLKGLGFKENDTHRQIEEFSGGWQMRVVLARMLLQRPDYLLLDEPTNHLDIESIIWLEKFLSSYHGAVIIISHDQQFLDNCTNRTVEIVLGKLHDYKAPYSKFIELRKDRQEKNQAAYENQQKLIAHKERTISRFMAKATKTKMAQSMQKQLDKLERIDVEQDDISAMRLQFAPAPRSGQVVIDARSIYKDFDGLQVLQNLNFILERGDRIAFVGQNGQGKTTFAKILIEKLAQSSGEITLGHNVTIGYYAQNQAETLDGSITLLETMEIHSPPEMRTQLRKILGAFLFSGEDVEKKVSVLSGGERARLALACMLLRPFNLLVLDEPTNHLDILSKKILKEAIKNYDGTLVVVSHDRHFLSELTDKTIEFRDRNIYEYLGDVNYFLQKRELENMRQVETTQETKSSSADPKMTAANEEKLKDISKKIKNKVRKIELLEAEIRTIESKMATDGFYQTTDSESILSAYKKLKTNLSTLMNEWEHLETQRELLEG